MAPCRGGAGIRSRHLRGAELTEWESTPIPQSHLSPCDFIGVSTTDDVTWDFGFNDEIKSIVDTGPDILGEDLLEAGFAAHPDIVAADHADREWFVLTFAREMEADEVLAICIDTLTHAHLELARHMATDTGSCVSEVAARHFHIAAINEWLWPTSVHG